MPWRGKSNRGLLLIAAGLALSMLTFYAARAYVMEFPQGGGLPQTINDRFLVIFLGSISGRILVGVGLIDLLLQRRRRKAFGEGSPSPVATYLGSGSGGDAGETPAPPDSMDRR